jgi:hypothetical protein
MASTYTPIATYTVSGSSTASYTFSSIPQTYTDLKLICSVSSSSGNAMLVRLNGVTGTSYSQTRILGTGSAASSATTGNLTRWASDAVATTSSVFGVCTIDFLNYANTTNYKTALFRDNDNLYVAASVKLFRGSTGSSTEAISSILLYPDAGNWTAGSTFTLYGIKAA